MKSRSYPRVGLLLIVSALLIAGCRSREPEPAAGLANPASVYCEGLGFEEETRTDDAGQYGVCIFPDRSECDSWDFLAGRCGNEHSYCVSQGYTLESSDESNVGTCVFADGTSCDEFAYSQGQCEPGE